MANVAHKNLTGVDLHEPKGIDAATEDTVYVADGLGSGSWTTVTRDALAATAKPAMTHLATYTVSGSSQIELNTGWSTDYKVIIFELVGVYPSVNHAGIQFQVSVNGGSSYLTSDYLCNAVGRTNSSGAALDNYTAGLPLTLLPNATDTTRNPSNDASFGLNGFIKVYPYANDYQGMVGQLSYVAQSGTGPAVIDVGGIIKNNGIINGARIVPSSGNISGAVYMFGLRVS